MLRRRRTGLLVVSAAAALVAVSVTPLAAAVGPERGLAGPQADGIAAARSFALAECRPGTTTAARGCSHGPDAAPRGVSTSRDGLAETSGSTPADASGAVPCYGDGTTGKRVQAVYAHAPDVASRYDDAAPQIRNWAAAVDRVFADSAAATGGVRHVRWVTGPDCALDVVDLTLGASTDDDSYAATVSAMAAQGYARSDRKYVVWTDAGLYCGIADFVDDDSASARNANNRGPSYARIDRGCWGLANPVEAHELMHTLGGVQYSAPHSSGSGHCLDENDRMCYQDSVFVSTTSACEAAHERLFDCGHDDYFSTNPPAGSYLSQRWNTASSAFLESVEPGAATTTKSRQGRKR